MEQITRIPPWCLHLVSSAEKTRGWRTRDDEVNQSRQNEGETSKSGSSFSAVSYRNRRNVVQKSALLTRLWCQPEPYVQGDLARQPRCTSTEPTAAGMRLTLAHGRVAPDDDQSSTCRPQVLEEKPNPKAGVAYLVGGAPIKPSMPMVPSKPTRVKPARGPPAKRTPLLLRLRRLRNGCSKLCFSPIGAVLVICCFSLVVCVAEIFSPPPFGINTGANGAECNATGFEPMPICICVPPSATRSSSTLLLYSATPFAILCGPALTLT